MVVKEYCTASCHGSEKVEYLFPISAFRHMTRYVTWLSDAPSESFQRYSTNDANTFGPTIPTIMYYGPWSGLGCSEVLVLICRGGQFRSQVSLIRNAQTDVVYFTGFSDPPPAIVHALVRHN